MAGGKPLNVAEMARLMAFRICAQQLARTVREVSDGDADKAQRIVDQVEAGFARALGSLGGGALARPPDGSLDLLEEALGQMLAEALAIVRQAAPGREQ